MTLNQKQRIRLTTEADFSWLLFWVFVYLYLTIRYLHMNFKYYNQNQTVLFPYSFEELIPNNHPVRIVNDILERINIAPSSKSLQQRGKSQLSSRDDAQGDGFCLYEQHLFLPENRKSTSRKHQLYVALQYEHRGS